MVRRNRPVKMGSQCEKSMVNSILDRMNLNNSNTVTLDLSSESLTQCVCLHLISIEYSRRYLLTSPLPLPKALSLLKTNQNPVAPPTVLNNTTIHGAPPNHKVPCITKNFLCPTFTSSDQVQSILPSKYFSYLPSTLSHLPCFKCLLCTKL